MQNRLTTSDSYSAEPGGDQYKDKEATILKILLGSSFHGIVFHGSSKTQLKLIVFNVLVFSVGDIFILGKIISRKCSHVEFSLSSISINSKS